ncbi:hypothetical protein EIP86_003885 [Pleurotus ostreatoroseus]|nr:hypothetical protein EIP86_003885 [Pleurotus ostreatoroseus]
MQGLTRTQMLEENISLLESRIRELENPSSTTPSVRLHAPQIVTTAASGSSVMSSPSSPAPVAGPSTTGAGPSSPVQQAHSGTLPQGSQPTVQDTQIMVTAFTPHASQVGFFMNIPRFMQLFYTPQRSREPFVESLLSTVCLWGSRLSRSAALSAFEEALLARAVHLVSGSLFLANTKPRGHAIIGVIQAEVLLSNYFFTLGRFLEAKYHCSAAASLTISCRLNDLGNRQDPRSHGGLAMDLVRSPDLGLAPIETIDSVQAGEQVDAFWTVFILDKMWAVALGAASSITDQITGGTPISTPWPLSMEAYEKGERAAFDDGASPFQNFLSVASTADGVSGLTALALRARASVLFSRASLLASQYQDDMPNTNEFWHEFNKLDSLINAFITAFPQVIVASRGGRERLVAGTIARVAVIQLHVRFVREQTRSRQRCLMAANEIVTSVQDIKRDNLGFLDPIMAVSIQTDKGVPDADSRFAADPDTAHVCGPSHHRRDENSWYGTDVRYGSATICCTYQFPQPDLGRYERLRRRLSADGLVVVFSSHEARFDHSFLSSVTSEPN